MSIGREWGRAIESVGRTISAAERGPSLTQSTPMNLPDSRPTILDVSAGRMLLETDRAVVGRFQLISLADLLAVHQDHGMRSVNKDLQEKPLVILASQVIRGRDIIQAASGVGAIWTIEALHLDAGALAQGVLFCPQPRG